MKCNVQVCENNLVDEEEGLAKEKMGIDTEVQGNDEEAEGSDEEVEGNDEAVQGDDEVESVTDGWAQEEDLLLPVSSPRDQAAKGCTQTCHPVICRGHSLLTGHACSILHCGCRHICITNTLPGLSG